ncbi:MAG: hemerythrin domain-containing protein [Pyrinomonadaceae bacterium]
MDVFDLLKKDHEKVSGIFEKLEPTTERATKTREELFTQLKQELDLHAQLEETHFYPVIKREAETRAITFEGFEEHAVIKTLLQELATTPVESEQWTAKLKVLKENVEHHVEEEEGEMFPKAKEVLSREQIDDITRRIEAGKQQAMPKSVSAG